MAGKPLAVYMGDDSRGEYIYKFVSSANWDAADANAGQPHRHRRQVPRQPASCTWRSSTPTAPASWIELSIANAAIAGYAGYAFADQADVLVNARLAADAVGATKMDRPEWCAVHPGTGEIYYTLTNNSNRKLEPSGRAQIGARRRQPARLQRLVCRRQPSAQPGNINGHIIRMAEAGGERRSHHLQLGRLPVRRAVRCRRRRKINLSSLTADQDFSSPDGLWFSQSTGLCWIQTDDGAYTDATNCMMLAGVPGQVGDGAKTTLSYTKTDGSTLSVDTYVGKAPTADTLRRFLVGPVDCELTGCTETPDGKTLFVNIQHPGEMLAAVADIADPSKYPSHWPGNAGYGAGGATARPRSATLAITKNDGGRIGS